MRIVFALALAVSVGCSDSDIAGTPVANPPAVQPLAGFGSNSILVVSSEFTPTNFTVLSLDAATGEVGQLAGSPIDAGVTISDAETLAAFPADRRVYFGGNLSGTIAALGLDAAGVPTPIAGSPFPAQSVGVSVVKADTVNNLLYVGYHGSNILSVYPVNPATGAVGALQQSISTGANSSVETMLLVGSVLYVGFGATSTIAGYQLEPAGGFTLDAQNNPVVAASVAVGIRPDYLVTLNGRLYCSLAVAAAVDAFTIEADGSLTRLAGAPYAFPGMGLFELIVVQPGGAHIGVGGERPTGSVGLFSVNGDGSLTATGPPLPMHDRGGGPEGMVFSADGRFMYVCDHIGHGLFVYEIVAGQPVFFRRYELPGRQIDVLRLDITVN